MTSLNIKSIFSWWQNHREENRLSGIVAGNPVNPVVPSLRSRAGPFRLALSSAELAKCIAFCITAQFGITTILGIIGVATGQPWIGAPGKLAGATPGTSIASKGLSKLFATLTDAFGLRFPQRLPVRLPAPVIIPKRGQFLKGLSRTSPVLGRVLGRWVPIIGWGLLAYDAIKILLCILDCLF